MTNALTTIKLSRIPGNIPRVSMLGFNEFSWNIADGILYGKGLDEHGYEIIIAIGGSPTVDNVHQRRHAVDSPDDHAAAKPADYGKYVRADPVTGDIIFDEGGDKHLAYPFNHQSSIVIQHGLKKQPSVQVRDTDGNICLADVQHIDQNHTKVTTTEPFTGVAIFN